jgi:hypothetical protein
MHITDYKYIHGTEDRGNYIAIPELNRHKHSAQQFIKLANLDITLTRPSAFLYVDGVSLSPSESGLNQIDIKNYIPKIKGTAAYIVHEWVDTFKGIEYLQKVDVMSGTCAAGIQAVYEAQRILNEGIIKDVIIIGSERITEDTLTLFKQLQIPIICGDGFFYMKISCYEDDAPMIFSPEWKYTHQRNPFMFPREVLDTLIPDYPVDFVKLHGTGTESNKEAEAGLASIAKVRVYKHVIGHTQGISALLETCILLDDCTVSGRILVTANGLGGNYGAFTLIK